MSDDEWNDEARNDLRATLQSIILGELRLAKRDWEEIFDTCREVYIEDECPENELDEFLQFTGDELQRIEAQLASERAGWPTETDCDRIDRVEAALRDRGIVFWQASPCCDTCTGAELPIRIDEIEKRFPGFRERVRGYAFFIDQNLPEMLAEGTELSIYLAYGWFSPEKSENDPAAYEQHAIGIAREVCRCLRDEGFEVDWDGDLARKIGVSINWRRRTLLT